MKHHRDEWRTGYGPESLYDTFIMMHGGGANYGWHYTSIFPYAHKAALWLYESAMFYVGIREGASIGISNAEMCNFALLYWDWEIHYDSRTVKTAPYPILQSSVFDSTLLGSTNVESGTYRVLDGLFKGDTTGNFVLYKEVCSVAATSSGGVTTPASGCDKNLKRTLDPAKAPGLDPTQIMQAIYSRPNFIDFCPWINANGHNGAHGFIGMSMAATMQSPDDPFFWLHHCNVDRFLHLWMDCLDYEKIPKDQITPQHYQSINPTSGSVVKDKYGVPIVFTADTPITFYLSSSRAPKYLPASDFPTVRQLWKSGEATTSDWNGLRVRYGPDSLAQNVISTVCVPGNQWYYVNYGASAKRSEDQPNESDKAYEDITDMFMYLTEEQSMTPERALDKMAWDYCMANPTNMTEDYKKFLRGMGMTPMDVKRICDDPEDLKLSEEEMATWAMDDHMSHEM
jgi:hypothetical protein